MYKRIGTKKLGRTMAHRKALVNNLVRSLVKRGQIKTTSVKAKVVKSEVESLLSKTRKSAEGDLNIRRKLQIVLGNTELVKKFIEVSKKEDSNISIKKVGFRAGDNAEVSMLELVGIKVKKVGKKTTEKETKEKPEEVEEKTERRNLLNLGGRKSISKRVDSGTKERAKSRSGL
jgi:large subunit ribosomal protein L17